jgi:hypothetical protein
LLLPLALMETTFQVAGANPQASFVSQTLNMFRGMLIAVAIAVLVLTAAGSRSRRAGAPQPGPRPRWQYLALSATWLSLAAALLLAALHYGDGVTWPSRACFAAGEWSALAGLTMLGRGILRGRIRGMFWWHRPTWLEDPPHGEAP